MTLLRRLIHLTRAFLAALVAFEAELRSDGLEDTRARAA
jgi:hypothetical protein